jgi:microcystin-dependent protein
MPGTAGGPYIGQIMMVGFNFAPVNWAFCNGALMAIAENEALFNLIGTTYGGDGQTTFALPDLRSRVPVGTGQGAGLSNYVIGEMSGVETVTLNVNQLPSHAHVVNPAANSGEQTSSRPDNNFPAVGGYYAATTNGSPMGAPTLAPAGGNQPHNNIQRVVGINFIILAVRGLPEPELVPRIERRAASAADEPFLRALYASTRPEVDDWPDEPREAFLAQQFEAQRTGWTASFPGSEHDVLVVDGLPVGRIWVHWSESDCLIVDLAFLPEHRRLGSGRRSSAM